MKKELEQENKVKSNLINNQVQYILMNVMFINFRKGLFVSERDKKTITYANMEVVEVAPDGQGRVTKLKFDNIELIPELTVNLVAGDVIKVKLDYASLGKEPKVLDIVEIIAESIYR